MKTGKMSTSHQSPKSYKNQKEKADVRFKQVKNIVTLNLANQEVGYFS